VHVPLSVPYATQFAATPQLAQLAADVVEVAVMVQPANSTHTGPYAAAIAVDESYAVAVPPAAGAGPTVHAHTHVAPEVHGSLVAATTIRCAYWVSYIHVFASEKISKTG